jgi:ribosomal protein S18 acetylase RimI-like enzyme
MYSTCIVPDNYLLRLAQHQSDYERFEELAREYHDWLDVSLHFSGFERELMTLPGCYAPPRGGILLASHSIDGGKPQADIGCLGIRPLSKHHHEDTAESDDSWKIGEVKHVWVQPDHQSSGIGRALMTHVIEHAKSVGYHALVLDTLESLVPAMKLYESLGFYQRDAYYPNPLPGVVYWQKDL